MNIQERLAAFDGWLTGRLDEAYAARRDLAFRDVVADEPTAGPPWEYSLLEAGARCPAGEGWSVYRLNGLWPEQMDEPDGGSRSPASGRRPSLIQTIAAKVLGRRPGR